MLDMLDMLDIFFQFIRNFFHRELIGHFQIADFYERFQRMCKRPIKLDPSYYLSASHLSLVATLTFTKANLELLSDPRLTEMIDSGMVRCMAIISRLRRMSLIRYTWITTLRNSLIILY